MADTGGTCPAAPVALRVAEGRADDAVARAGDERGAVRADEEATGDEGTGDVEALADS